jgi:16S rRNA U516 pseudouridylate synthase RsuA-like enzyme
VVNLCQELQYLDAVGKTVLKLILMRMGELELDSSDLGYGQVVGYLNMVMVFQVS